MHPSEAARQLLSQPADSQPLEEYVPDRSLDLADYEPFIGAERVAALAELVAPLEGKSWVHINSTFAGGGVAEMLMSVIPLARGMGIDARWYTIRGDDAFFSVTKTFHNTLQGLSQPVTLQDLLGTYIDWTERNARNTALQGDLIVVHDPQPLGLIGSGRLLGNILWRCHIDTSNPDPTVWRFLRPYINQAAGAIFTLDDYVGPGLNLPIYQIHPAIDPLAIKNHEYGAQEALDVLAPLLDKHDIDPERPLVVAISRYDPHKNQARIYQAFRRMCSEKSFPVPPLLVFIGNTADDDPEGGVILNQLRSSAEGDPNVRFLVNVEDNDRVIGAMMKAADVFVHVSTREGFGLVVTEAMWQGTPVIGSTAGGITRQVIDERTGLVVDPLDVDAIAAAMHRVLEGPEEAAQLAAAGKEHVREHFLLPELIRKYAVLMRYHLGVDHGLPDFRLNPVPTPNEWVDGIRRRSPLMGD